MLDYYYITTPIYYVNDAPHIGHAYTSVATDVIARFMRLAGKKVLFCTGTDEHGQKIQKSAIQKHISPQDFVDYHAHKFQELMQVLNISHDDFIRTTESRHKEAVKQLWQKLENSGNIYLGKYSGWYSVRDECFYNEDELIEEPTTKQKLAPTKAPVEWLEEESYFFALSKWQEPLLKFYEKNPDFVKPAGRFKEVISFVKSGLSNLSISRASINWGIPVPSDPQHVIYVWLDALTNYLTTVGYPWSDNSQITKQYFWPVTAHIIGKDILRFHAVYWPAFLMAAGIKLPKNIFAHGWWTKDGAKISKSLGNVIDPLALVDEFGLDQTRYFLMREVIFGNDGNYTRESFVNRVNSELVNKIGNLMQRVMVFIYKNNQAQIPVFTEAEIAKFYQEENLLLSLPRLAKENIELMEGFEINKVLDNIIFIADNCNNYIDTNAPWKLKDSNPLLVQKILYLLAEALRYIAIMLQPFTPNAADKMLQQLEIPTDERTFKHLVAAHALKVKNKIIAPTAIFPRLQ